MIKEYDTKKHLHMQVLFSCPPAFDKFLFADMLY